MPGIKLNNEPSPCPRDCPLRTPGCHGDCKSYQDYAARRHREYDLREQSAQLFRGSTEAKKSAIHRIVMRSKKGNGR